METSSPASSSTVLPSLEAETGPARQDSALGERSFEHAPLDNTRNEIRLLEIHRSKLDGRYNVSVTRWPITAAPRYAAISYTWGDDEAIDTIWLNKQAFKVTKNCRYAIKQLHYLSPYQQYRYYWIDSICIDQSRNDERSHQVNMMGDIFSRADCVFVSLGKHAEGSEHLFDNIPMTGFDRRKSSIAWLDGLDSETSWDVYRGLVATSHAPYWTRVWVLQEFILARRLTILCGDSWADWQTLYDIMSTVVVHRGRMCVHANKTFRAMRDQITDSAMRLSADARCPAHRMAYDDQGKPRRIERRMVSQNLSAILRIVRGRRCTDSRDRIFGILGLVNWLQYDSPVLADYSLSRLEVAIRSVSHLDHVMGSLHDIDLGLLLDTLELSISDADFEGLVASRRVRRPPRTTHTSKVVPSWAMSGLWEFAATDQKGGMLPHDGGAPLAQNMILSPDCTLVEGDIAVECLSGQQFILRWLEGEQWQIIGVAKFLSGLQRSRDVKEMKHFTIFMGAEDLLVWYFLETRFETEAALGSSVRLVDSPTVSYALEEAASDVVSDLESKPHFPISDLDMF
ncbi:Heterokaryon incompatibility protein 6, OR allele [Fulvia fulva]|uniref:Heterokaryon incompatibility protein 6, OR allele n=1 Tax=Passalora fulva TaxID=5499 RepID=A0A9Q8LIH3_PASFU|nr:Heterokaryon incompatibility protein 6, OR allele [Fulvia fulva]KAK4624728.1 Heterokaryon incompatibility protein 6, OR allele [Fulvia fulva]KAK4626000.1 Heterokaryon incompatibility protein 6, OR allele [Fulvia fulva]UJO17995.1 Heterokaryon incompatibility protein 6, OR allele [Fulvia fulva]WPV14901.1 Heterokaryon incompatibility protein 6, OR allele [Fulvia fulva]WPV29804.1 Heterokaryon incompatibility protein 6, OR allele [Fulvia fulva]